MNKLLFVCLSALVAVSFQAVIPELEALEASEAGVIGGKIRCDCITGFQCVKMMGGGYGCVRPEEQSPLEALIGDKIRCDCITGFQCMKMMGGGYGCVKPTFPEVEEKVIGDKIRCDCLVGFECIKTINGGYGCVRPENISPAF